MEKAEKYLNGSKVVKEQRLVTEKLLKAKHCSCKKAEAVDWDSVFAFFPDSCQLSLSLRCLSTPCPSLLKCLSATAARNKDFICIVKGVSGMFLGSAVSTRPVQLICLEDVRARLLTLNIPALHKWRGCAAASVPGGHSSWQTVSVVWISSWNKCELELAPWHGADPHPLRAWAKQEILPFYLELVGGDFC